MNLFARLTARSQSSEQQARSRRLLQPTPASADACSPAHACSPADACLSRPVQKITAAPLFCVARALLQPGHCSELWSMPRKSLDELPGIMKIPIRTCHFPISSRSLAIRQIAIGIHDKPQSMSCRADTAHAERAARVGCTLRDHARRDGADALGATKHAHGAERRCARDRERARQMQMAAAST